MKLIIILVSSLYLQSACAETNQYGSVKTDKLYIAAKTHDNKPENWLKYYKVNSSENTQHEKRIYIAAHFNIKNVTHMIITDVNASNNKCGKKQEKEVLYLSINPDKNIHKVSTRIHLPCLFKRNAILKLAVKTSTGERYYNTTTLTAHPNAFDTVYID